MVEEVEVEATDVGFNFDGTVITPVMLRVPDAMPVGTRITSVIPTRLKLRIVK